MPVLLEWSTCHRLRPPGLSIPQMAQQPFCATTMASYSATVRPYFLSCLSLRYFLMPSGSAAARLAAVFLALSRACSRFAARHLAVAFFDVSLNCSGLFARHLADALATASRLASYHFRFHSFSDSNLDRSLQRSRSDSILAAYHFLPLARCLALRSSDQSAYLSLATIETSSRLVVRVGVLLPTSHRPA
jgi:hypothetical protein